MRYKFKENKMKGVSFMENLRILSMDLGKRYIPIKDRNKKRFVTEFLAHENYDVVMLQGSHISSNVDLEYLRKKGCSIHQTNNELITFSNQANHFFSSIGNFNVNTSTLCFNRRTLPLININCKDKDDFKDVYNFCKRYMDYSTEYYTGRFLITGKFPREVDTNEFCDMLDLDDISSRVALDSYEKYNHEMLNHFFISRNLECRSIHKLVGMTEVAKIAEAYPMEVVLTHKKVLK